MVSRGPGSSCLGFPTPQQGAGARAEELRLVQSDGHDRLGRPSTGTQDQGHVPRPTRPPQVSGAFCQPRLRILTSGKRETRAGLSLRTPGSPPPAVVTRLVLLSAAPPEWPRAAPLGSGPQASPAGWLTWTPRDAPTDGAGGGGTAGTEECRPDTWPDGVGPSAGSKEEPTAWVSCTPHSPTLPCPGSDLGGPAPSAPTGDMAQPRHPALPTRAPLALPVGPVSTADGLGGGRKTAAPVQDGRPGTVGRHPHPTGGAQAGAGGPGPGLREAPGWGVCTSCPSVPMEQDWAPAPGLALDRRPGRVALQGPPFRAPRPPAGEGLFPRARPLPPAQPLCGAGRTLHSRVGDGLRALATQCGAPGGSGAMGPGRSVPPTQGQAPGRPRGEPCRGSQRQCACVCACVCARVGDLSVGTPALHLSSDGVRVSGPDGCLHAPHWAVREVCSGPPFSECEEPRPAPLQAVSKGTMTPGAFPAGLGSQPHCAAPRLDRGLAGRCGPGAPALGLALPPLGPLPAVGTGGPLGRPQTF